MNANIDLGLTAEREHMRPSSKASIISGYGMKSGTSSVAGSVGRRSPRVSFVDLEPEMIPAEPEYAIQKTPKLINSSATNDVNVQVNAEDSNRETPNAEDENLEERKIESDLVDSNSFPTSWSNQLGKGSSAWSAV